MCLFTGKTNDSAGKNHFMINIGILGKNKKAACQSRRLAIRI